MSSWDWRALLVVLILYCVVPLLVAVLLSLYLGRPYL